MTSIGESRETFLGADAKSVLKQRALATLHRVRQAHDGEWLLARSFAIQPLVRRQELLQHHSVAEPTTKLRIDLVSSARMPPPLRQGGTMRSDCRPNIARSNGAKLLES